MNLEQIVKETVAKIVAEKQGKDLTGDGKIDSADYLKARSNAIEKAMKNEGDSEDHEVSMAQSSLNSILRSAMELKTKIGNQEINIPAWIQDHITNSENFIDQASQGYHEYNNGGEHGEMDEANLGHNELSSIEPEGRFWIVKYGTEEKVFDSEDEARKFYDKLNKSKELDEVEGTNIRQGLVQAVIQKYGDQLKPMLDKYNSSSAEWSQILKQYGSNSSEFKTFNDGHKIVSGGFKNAALNAAAKELKSIGASDTQIRNYFSEYGPFEDWVSDYINELMDELGGSQVNEASESNNDKIAKYEKYTYTLNGETVKPEITFLNNILKAMIGNKIYNVSTPENGKVELSPESGKKGMYTESQQELDEYVIRRWQHYAGIK